MVKSHMKKRFIFIICLLLLTQECIAKNIYHNSLLSELVDDVNDMTKETFKDQNDYDVEIERNEKRWIVPALVGIELFSGAFDIYQEEVGCKLTNPNLITNLKSVESKRAQLRQMRTNQIPEWNKVYASQGYLERIDSSLLIVQNLLQKISKTEEDIVRLFDSNFLSKMNQTAFEIEQQIERNSSFDINPTNILNEFYKGGEVTRKYSQKISQLAVWTGSRSLGPFLSRSVIQSVAKSKTRAGILSRVGKSRGPSAQVSLSTWAKTRTTVARFVGGQTADMADGVKMLSNTGKFVITGFILAVEIYSAWRFFHDCKKKEVDSYEMVALADESIANMTKLSNELNSTDQIIVGNYSKIFDIIVSTPFHNAIRHAQNVAINAQSQNKTLENNAQDYQLFLDNINKTKTGHLQYDFSRAEHLMNVLIKALITTAQNLNCYRKKIATVAKLKVDCALGITSMTNLWNIAQIQTGRIKKECKSESGPLIKEKLFEVIKNFMKSENKSTHCIRNNAMKKELVCNILFESNKSNSDLRNEIGGGLTIEDVEYFKTKCSSYELNPKMKLAICFMKSRNRNITSVKEAFSVYNQTRVENVYKSGCNLTKMQITTICKLKSSGEPLHNVHSNYKYYSEFPTIYNDCVMKPSPVIIHNICLFSKLISHGDVTHRVHAIDVKRFGSAIVKSIIDTKCGRRLQRPQ